MNWLDSARLNAALSRAGHVPVNRECDADYVLVNSCTVTAQADRKSRQQANAARRAHKQVAVLGCGPRIDAQSYNNQLNDVLVFESEQRLFDYFGIEADCDPLPLNTRTRLPIAIQTGCDDVCGFCITRFVRGAHRSLPVEAIVRQIRHAEELGLHEVVLTGINLAAWGCDDTRHPHNARLHELLTAILAKTGIPRIRLSSLGPQYLSAGFFEVFADSRICDHLHLSVQSGSPGVLTRMARGHGISEVLNVAAQALAARPQAGLAADLIAGFPGETEAEFRETIDTVESVGFAKLHVFPFSARQGTPAAGASDQVPGEVKKIRAAELRVLGDTLRQRFIHSQWGTGHVVLTEKNATGLTPNYIRVSMPGEDEGELRPVRLGPHNTVAG